MAEPEWLAKYRKYAAPSKKAAPPPDRAQFNTPAPKPEVKEQCKNCQTGGRLHCKGRDHNCGCRWCT